MGGRIFLFRVLAMVAGMMFAGCPNSSIPDGKQCNTLNDCLPGERCTADQACVPADASSDGGMEADAGAAPDSGPIADAGTTPDGGAPLDAGTTDGGESVEDAGATFSIDAGQDGGIIHPEDCKAVLAAGGTTNGYYTIDPDGAFGRPPFSTFCIQDLGGGGWTTIVNNLNADLEPSGCIPRVGSQESLVCDDGNLSLTDDGNVAAWTLTFTEAAWIGYGNQDLTPLAYRLFQWDAPQSFPHAATWQLIADNANNTLTEYAAAAIPLISCEFQGGQGLDALVNGNPVNAGAYANTQVVTFFYRGTNFTATGRMGFTGTNTDGADSLNGLDDFQDGYGCGDDWSPKAIKGASSLLVVR